MMRLFGLLCVLPMVAWATPMSHPVPVQVDGARHPSHLSLRFDAQALDQSLQAFAADAGHDAADGVARDFLRATLARDGTAVGRVLDRRTLNGGVDEAVALWHRAFKGFAGAQMQARIELGDRSLFVFTVPMPSGPWMRGFKVFRRGTAWQVDWIDSAHPVESLVMRTYAAHQADPERFAARPATHGTHRLTLAPRLDLEFDGATLDYDVFTQSAPADPALQAHQSVWALFHAGQIKPFSDRHDARSRKKLEGWHAARARQMRSWWAYVRQGRRAAFWMRGQDFALVFAAEGPPTAKRLMRWDWMQRTPTGWRPIKFGRFDAVDVALLSILPATEAEFDAAMGRTRR